MRIVLRIMIDFSFNQDDCTRNIAFLLDRQGRWRLSPAFDVVWAYNPSGDWFSDLDT